MTSSPLQEAMVHHDLLPLQEAMVPHDLLPRSRRWFLMTSSPAGGNGTS